jgi:hypothetical protein
MMTTQPKRQTIAFLRALSNVVFVRVPETLIFGFGFTKPSLVYSTRAGKLEAIEDVFEQRVSEFLEF